MTFVRFAKEPALNIHKTETVLSKADPLARIFQSIFKLLPCYVRGHAVACLGELIGTIFFYFIAFAGTQVAYSASPALNNVYEINAVINLVTPSVVLYIALSVGFSLAVAAWVFCRVSGGLFNPVVSSPKQQSSEKRAQSAIISPALWNTILQLVRHHLGLQLFPMWHLFPSKEPPI